MTTSKTSKLCFYSSIHYGSLWQLALIGGVWIAVFLNWVGLFDMLKIMISYNIVTSYINRLFNDSRNFLYRARTCSK